MSKWEWTVERTETAKKMWLEGRSALEIARHIGAQSRNAVLGKMLRVGCVRGNVAAKIAMQRGGKRGARKAREVSKSIQPASPDAKASARLAYDAALERMEAAKDTARKPLEDLEHSDCRWPVGTPGEPEFGFCADPKMYGLPYCGRHAARAYRHEMPVAGAGVAAGAQTRHGGDHHSHEPKREKIDALEGVE